jgi:hypothetical protein
MHAVGPSSPPNPPADRRCYPVELRSPAPLPNPSVGRPLAAAPAASGTSVKGIKTTTAGRKFFPENPESMHAVGETMGRTIGPALVVGTPRVVIFAGARSRARAPRERRLTRLSVSSESYAFDITTKLAAGATESCVNRRGLVTEANGALEHFCLECGRFGNFGCGVSLRRGRMGRWYCGQHRPSCA